MELLVGSSGWRSWLAPRLTLTDSLATSPLAGNKGSGQQQRDATPGGRGTNAANANATNQTGGDNGGRAGSAGGARGRWGVYDTAVPESPLSWKCESSDGAEFFFPSACERVTASLLVIGSTNSWIRVDAVYPQIGGS